MIIRRISTIGVIIVWLCGLLWAVPPTSAVEELVESDVTPTSSCASNTNNVDGTCKSDPETSSAEISSQEDTASECGVWLALSTLPGTGIGMFAGKNFTKKQHFLLAGDHMVPIVDLVKHHGSDTFFLWNDYTWTGDGLDMDHFGVSETNIASPGFGAAANSFMDFVNADEMYPQYSIPHGLHRRSDPGAGAFTYYHSRHTMAESDVMEGQELFVSYGNRWFVGRRKKLGPIPIKGDHTRADRLYRRFRHKFIDQDSGKRKKKNNMWGRHKDLEATGEVLPPPPSEAESVDEKLVEAATELWDTFVLNSEWDDSPTMAAFPPKEDYDAMYSQTLIRLKKSRMQRGTEWLTANGACADNMYFGESTFRQAGHGAFASRPLREGSIILPVPLIHIPDRRVLNMYELTATKSGEPVQPDKERPRPPQLLLNYCLGHRDSTMLLSPYGPMFNLINHNQTLVNVKLQWASPERSQHKPEMLQKNVTEFENLWSAQLAMELVAIKNIQPGEEIFLDYGDDWEAAWQKHVEEWQPVDGADKYVSAFEMNQQFDHVYRTVFEQMKDPYPSNLMLKFYKTFENDKQRRDWLQKYPTPRLHSALDSWVENGSVHCDILRHKEVGDRIVYAIAIPGKTEVIRIEDVPQEAIIFEDRPYTADLFLKNAFRHDIRAIPEDIFPEQWKNLR